MTLGPSINALQSIQAEFNQMPSRIFDSFHNPESRDGLEKVFTDMIVGESSYVANIKSLRTMATVEDMILNELRE